MNLQIWAVGSLKRSVPISTSGHLSFFKFESAYRVLSCALVYSYEVTIWFRGEVAVGIDCGEKFWLNCCNTTRHPTVSFSSAARMNPAYGRDRLLCRAGFLRFHDEISKKLPYARRPVK